MVYTVKTTGEPAVTASTSTALFTVGAIANNFAFSRWV